MIGTINLLLKLATTPKQAQPPEDKCIVCDAELEFPMYGAERPICLECFEKEHPEPNCQKTK